MGPTEEDPGAASYLQAWRPITVVAFVILVTSQSTRPPTYRREQQTARKAINTHKL